MSRRGLTPLSNTGGSGGPGSALPAPPTSDGTYDLLVASGVASWELVGGDQILTFTGITATVEVGMSRASFTWASTYNTTPTTITLSWSGVATGSMNIPVTGTSSGGTVNGPFVSATNNTSLVVTLTVVFPDGTKSKNQSILWAAKVIYGSVAGALTPGQALWNALNASGSQLHATRGGAYSFTSPIGENQVFGVLNSLGVTQFTDPATGFTYPFVPSGAPVVIVENGTNQTVQFGTAGNPGSTITLDMD
jgi:hypothetical protein